MCGVRIFNAFVCRTANASATEESFLLQQITNKSKSENLQLKSFFFVSTNA